MATYISDSTLSSEVRMVAGPFLTAYLALERAMVDLDDARNPGADQLRDQMDPIWRNLSDRERNWLDLRAGEASVFAGKPPSG